MNTNTTPNADVADVKQETPNPAETQTNQQTNDVADVKQETPKTADDAQASLVQQIGKALGLIKDDDDTPTPDDLTRQLAAEQDAKRSAQTALAVYRAAQGIADPDMLTDSTRFHKALADVDITDQQAVTDAVKAFIKDHPQYSGTRAPQAGGANTIDHPAGSGETTPQSTSLNQAVARALAGK